MKKEISPFFPTSLARPQKGSLWETGAEAGTIQRDVVRPEVIRRCQ